MKLNGKFGKKNFDQKAQFEPPKIVLTLNQWYAKKRETIVLDVQQQMTS